MGRVQFLSFRSLKTFLLVIRDKMATTEVVKDSDRDDTRELTVPADEEYASSTNDGVQQFAYSDSRKIGVTGAVFLILNKMIGTGSKSRLIS